MSNSIQVAVRVRPFNDREKQMGSSLCVEMEDTTTTITSDCAGKEGAEHVYAFDFSFWSHDPSDSNFASQDTVMSSIGEAIIQNALDGFNGTLFAYGQTGSGKSFSVTGAPNAPGILPRTITRLFEQKEELTKQANCEFLVWISYLEIYNEEVYDLLTHEKGKQELAIVDHPQLGVIVRDLLEIPCESPDDVNKLLDYGQQQRAIAATAMNAQSSRSHTVSAIRIQKLTGEKPKTGKKDKRTTMGAKLTFIDLAGSERTSKTMAQGSTAAEGQAINKSLSALTRIISELGKAISKAEKAGKPLPSGKETAGLGWRASKLTFLLRDSVAGNSKTYLIAALSPASDNVEETLSTLEFAKACKKCKSKPSANKVLSKDDALSTLKRELEELKKQHDVDESRIEEEQKLLDDLHAHYDGMTNATEVIAQRAEATKDSMLTADEITSEFGLSKGTPYLVNMSSDPSLAGCLLFVLEAGKPATVGSAADSVIKVTGPGIADELCVIKNADGRAVTITKTGSQGRVLVNRRVLRPATPENLENGQQLTFGRHMTLKVVIPSSIPEGENTDSKRDLHLEEELENEWTSIEDSPSWGKVQEDVQVFVQQVIEQMPPDQAKALTDRIEAVVHACDEANDITCHCRQDAGVHFEVDIITSPPPSVSVRVLKNNDNNYDKACLYIWTSEEMMERIVRMRDYSYKYSQTGGCQEEFNTIHDPWYQADYKDIQNSLNELHLKLEQDNSMDVIRSRTVTAIQLDNGTDPPQNANGGLQAVNYKELQLLRKENALLKSGVETSQSAVTQSGSVAMLQKENAELKSEIAELGRVAAVAMVRPVAMLQRRLEEAQAEIDKLKAGGAESNTNIVKDFGLSSAPLRRGPSRLASQNLNQIL